jgi:hypothetical protein
MEHDNQIALIRLHVQIAIANSTFPVIHVNVPCVYEGLKLTLAPNAAMRTYKALHHAVLNLISRLSTWQLFTDP